MTPEARDLDKLHCRMIFLASQISEALREGREDDAEDDSREYEAASVEFSKLLDTLSVQVAEAVREEREACAQIAESVRSRIMLGDWKQNEANFCDVVADAIRLRGARSVMMKSPRYT